MKVNSLIPMAVLLMVVSGCGNVANPSLLEKEVPMQGENQLLSPSDNVVTFADPTIEAAVRGVLQKPNEPIMEADLLEITVLGDHDGSGDPVGDAAGTITTLSDLKWMKNLTALTLGAWGITSLAGVETLEKLEILHLRGNQIADLEPLRRLVRLKELDLSFNEITDIDVLDGLPNLEYVNISDNPVPEERIAAFFEPKEQDFFTREFRQQLGDTECIFEFLAFKSKDTTTYQTTKITVKNAESGAVIQEILPSEDTYFKEYPSFWADDLGVVVEDMNFDGYADIRIVESLPAGPNIPYTCWVWDTGSGQYTYSPELSAITSLEVDYENKLIRSFGRASAFEHFEETYRYIEGSLLRVKEVRMGFLDESDRNQGYSITHEWIDGQWVMTQKEKIAMGG